MVNLTTTCHPIRHFNILIAKLLILLHKYCIVDQWSVFTCCIASLTAGHYCLPILLQSAGNNTVNRTDGLVHLFVTNLLEDPWKFNREAGRFSQQVSPCNYNPGVKESHESMCVAYAMLFWAHLCNLQGGLLCVTYGSHRGSLFKVNRPHLWPHTDRPGCASFSDGLTTMSSFVFLYVAYSCLNVMPIYWQSVWLWFEVSCYDLMHCNYYMPLE